MKGNIFVFDVESIGVLGEGFAVGWAVLSLPAGENIETNIENCDPMHALSSDLTDPRADWAWLAQNCFPGMPPPNRRAPCDVRDAFWASWQKWHRHGAVLAHDNGSTVDLRFLTDGIRDDPDRLASPGMYPIIDIASVLWATGKSSYDNRARRPDERPQHNPLADALFSARNLAEATKPGRTRRRKR